MIKAILGHPMTELIITIIILTAFWVGVKLYDKEKEEELSRQEPKP